MDNMFEQASRIGLRFSSARGGLSVEDLWHLPLTSPTGRSINLDDIAKGLRRELKSEDEESFVKPAPVAALAEKKLAFEIVKHIISVLVAERDAASEAKAKSEQKQKLLSVLSRKKDQELEGKTAEEIEAMINSL